MCIIINSLHSRRSSVVVRVQPWTNILYFNQMFSTIPLLFGTAFFSSPPENPVHDMAWLLVAASDHMFYPLAFILFRIPIFILFFSLVSNIFAIFFERDYQFGELKLTRQRHIICTLYVARQTGRRQHNFVRPILDRPMCWQQHLRRYSNTDECDAAAAAILMGLYWSLPI